MDLHEKLQPFEYLLGTWSGQGRGFYPTIKDFEYTETVTFDATPGKPFFRYEQKTVGPNGPMHTELGFLRVVGDGQLEFILAQPTGQTEVLEGHVEEDEYFLYFKFGPSSVLNSATAKSVDVTARSYTLNGDRTEMTTRFDMGAAGQRAQQHLESTLTKHERD